MSAWLIAEREFRTYVATLSFWLALAVGPVLTAAAFALAPAAGVSAPVAVAIRAPDPDLARFAERALVEAGDMESRHYVRVAGGGRATLTIGQRDHDSAVVSFSRSFPLSDEGRLLVRRTLERDMARGLAASSRNAVAFVPANDDTGQNSEARADGGAPARFAMVAILWLTLTGSLGMLLQAVVRERANRALEGLLAAAQPWEIMAGKLAGVGAVSALILFAWLGSVAGLALLASREAGIVAGVLSGLAAPASLMRAALIYFLAYAFYGCVTFGLGAAARDVAAAQNISRPMFAVLLAAFFVALACAYGAHESWLLYVAPFTPFLLLIHAPGDLAPASQMEAIVLLILATIAAAWLAVGRLTIHNAWAARRA